MPGTQSSSAATDAFGVLSEGGRTMGPQFPSTLLRIHMKARLLPLAAFAMTLTITGCASIMHGTTQDIGISSSPTGASITIDNGQKAQTPFVAKLSRKQSHVV